MSKELSEQIKEIDRQIEELEKKRYELRKQNTGHFIGVVKIGDGDYWDEYYTLLPHMSEEEVVEFCREHSSKYFTVSEDLTWFEVDMEQYTKYLDWYWLDKAYNDLFYVVPRIPTKFKDTDTHKGLKQLYNSLEDILKDVCKELGIDYPESTHPKTKEFFERSNKCQTNHV